MRSMTGMGIGRAHRGGTEIRVEIRSVNNRFLDLSFRIPPALTEFEPALRERVQNDVTRGRVTINVERKSQRAILLGHKGERIKKVGTDARKDMETFFGKKVFLEQFIKVEPDWRKKADKLKGFGY